MLKFSIILCTVMVLYGSCKKTENRKLGKYSISVTYNTTAKKKPFQLEVFVDNNQIGELWVIPNTEPAFLADCEDLDRPQTMNNVFVVKDIEKGTHRIWFQTKSGNSYEPLQFQMLDNECVFQKQDLTQN